MTTNLTDQRIAELRAQAQRDTGPFVNPAHLQTVQHFTSGKHEWATSMLGRPFPGVRQLKSWEITLLALAGQAEPEPPRPHPPQQTLNSNQLPGHQPREQREWQQLRERLPVAVTVKHNYTSHRHTGLHTQGVEHAILREDLHVGRLRRSAGQPLCWTPSRAKDLRDFGYPDDVRQHLTCKECWKVARRITDTTNQAQEKQ